jgi:hypothetical protein
MLLRISATIDVGLRLRGTKIPEANDIGPE